MLVKYAYMIPLKLQHQCSDANLTLTLSLLEIRRDILLHHASSTHSSLVTHNKESLPRNTQQGVSILCVNILVKVTLILALTLISALTLTLSKDVYTDLAKNFLALAQLCSSVIVCRASPLQKAQVRAQVGSRTRRISLTQGRVGVHQMRGGCKMCSYNTNCTSNALVVTVQVVSLVKCHTNAVRSRVWGRVMGLG